ncbi:hypothetical protein QYF61_005278 [Mycteria americana]|uniref:Uncharacterized protein n=1 Tax=Mycteria americana TaxID=33587 RepID=A0AAN7SCU8_MYCAM|nr:hypothetical protein QYF61_005278 [Mycteria americana]
MGLVFIMLLSLPSNVGPSHRLQFFKNCSSMGPLHGVQSFRNGLFQCRSPTGHSSCQKTCSWLGSSPWATGLQEPDPVWALHKLQLPSGHVHLLQHGVFRRLQRSAKSCTWVGTDPGTHTCWWLTSWRAALQKSPKGPGGYQPDHEPATCPYPKEGQWYPGLHRRSVASRLREVILPLYSALVQS